MLRISITGAQKTVLMHIAIQFFTARVSKGYNGAQLGILLDEDEGSNRVVQFNRYATVSTAVRQNNGDYYRMTWDTTDTDMEAKVTALADIARQFTNNFLQRKFTDEKTAWNDYLKALNAAGYNEVYAYKQLSWITVLLLLHWHLVPTN